MNQKNLLILGEKTLKKFNIDDAHIKAKILLEFVLKQKGSELLINSLEEVSELKAQQYEEHVKEIINGKPLQYITNSQEFMGLNFYVDENVLIPQPDTELLVEIVIEKIQEKAKKYTTEGKMKFSFENVQNGENSESKPIKILDLCTGSGCIGISIAKYTNAKVTVTDISEEAIKVAKKNAALNNVEEKIEFIVSNLFENLEGRQFDYILSNPPYIETSTIKTLSKEVQNEPHIALDGGEDGLKFYKEILKNAYKYLLPNGYLILEIGYNQAENIINIYKKCYKQAENIINIYKKCYNQAENIINIYKNDYKQKENIINLCKKNTDKNKLISTKPLILKNCTKCKIEENLILETKTPIKDLAGNDRVLIFRKI